MIKIIAAVANNNVIGKGNDLPWHLPEDLKHFQKLTTGQIVLMGSRTFESIFLRLGKPLPNRRNIIVTQNKNYQVPEVVDVFYSLDEAREKLTSEDYWVIGGASIYQQMMEFADELYITHVDVEPDGDTFFPEINKSIWKKIEEEKHDGYRFAKYERIN